MSNKINWDSWSVHRFFHENVVKYGNGEYSVYVWLNQNEEPFYVGMGKGYRFHDTNEHSRSPEFLEIYNKGGCTVKIVAYGMNETQARKFEKDLILAYNGLGFNLVNKQYLVDYYTTKAGATKRHYWVVDGNIQTAQEWCSEYNITYSAVLKRLSYGLTLKEALTYPKVPTDKKPRLKSLDYWEKLGLSIGVDKSAKDLGNHTLSELDEIRSRLSLGKSLFRNDVVATYSLL